MNIDPRDSSNFNLRSVVLQHVLNYFLLVTPSGQLFRCSLSKYALLPVLSTLCVGSCCSLDSRMPSHDRADPPADSTCCLCPGYAGQPGRSQTGKLSIVNIGHSKVLCPNGLTLSSTFSSTFTSSTCCMTYHTLTYLWHFLWHTIL